jgi:acetoacetyl-CoA synthetase
MPVVSPLWTPPEKFVEQSNLTAYASWLKEVHGLDFPDYAALRQWSVTHPEKFWETIADYFKIIWRHPYELVMSSEPMPHTQWFSGGQLNYAEHIFRNTTDKHPAILFRSERHPLTAVSWAELREKVAALQAYFLSAGVKPGDRIAGYLPCIPEATICLLAAMSIGAVWSSCSPDFGTASVVERFRQIEPAILIAVDGYSYGGKKFDRMSEVASLGKSFPSLKKTILIPYLNEAPASGDIPNLVSWAEVMSTPHGGLQFTPVDFSHPVWILYSSGTTGIPKAITHSHGGVLLEHFKYLAFHNDVKPGERFFWFTTTGWMMWNYLNAALLQGATIVLYDGNPGYPDLQVLWKLAEAAPIHHFGTSAPYIIACNKAGVFPGKEFDLASLHSLSSTGSPLPPEAFEYVYDHIKKDLWLCSMSGGTDVCTAFVGGCPWLPVYEGEIQCRALGCDMYAWDENGNPVWDEVGEMVIKKAMPSMPVFFWGDPSFERYESSYFDTYPGVWRHGDWLKITPRETLVISGRSDATLNRQGVRIGTAEIYRAVDTITEIKDSLIVNIELPRGGDYMPLFVVMREGFSLTAEIIAKIKQVLRQIYSPRHVPDDIIAVDDIPYTISGKKMEMPVKNILSGRSPDNVVNKGSVRNPGSLEFFKAFREKIPKGGG